MRIAIVIGSLGYGGAERFVVDLANALAQNGHYVIIVIFSENAPLKHQLSNSVKLISLRYHKILKLLCIVKMMNLFIRKGIQVVDTHLFYSNVYGRIAAFFARVPVIVTHEHTLTPWKKWYHRLMELLLSKITHKVICISKTVALNRIQIEKLHPPKIAVIPLGIDFKRFTPNDRPKRSHVIGFIGRFTTTKNLNVLIEVYCEVLKKLPNARLMLIGDGPLRKRIEKTIFLKGLRDKVVITGFVNNVEDYLREMSVLVLTSIHEGFPVSVLEAMSMGVPVVASRVGALHELIKNGKNGFLACSGCCKTMSDYVVKLLTNENIRKKIGINARITAQRYDIHKVAKRHVKLYESILRKK
ncbi:MAG: glycosyltransferase family 4 protein [Candidatus Baldrarchaeia archaeon]